MISRLLTMVVSAGLMLIPSWIFLLAKYLLAPQGFWQNLVLYGLGIYILGGFQVMFFLVWAFLMFSMWAAYLTSK